MWNGRKTIYMVPECIGAFYVKIIQTLQNKDRGIYTIQRIVNMYKYVIHKEEWYRAYIKKEKEYKNILDDVWRAEKE